MAREGGEGKKEDTRESGSEPSVSRAQLVTPRFRHLLSLAKIVPAILKRGTPILPLIPLPQFHARPKKFPPTSIQKDENTLSLSTPLFSSLNPRLKSGRKISGLSVIGFVQSRSPISCLYEQPRIGVPKEPTQCCSWPPDIPHERNVKFQRLPLSGFRDRQRGTKRGLLHPTPAHFRIPVELCNSKFPLSSL